MLTLKELSNREYLFTGGHRACSGCGATIILRHLVTVAGPDTVIAGATGCMEVVTTIFPYTAWKIPFMHNAFENSAATISGIESAYKALKKKGKIKKKINFIAFGGDGGTYDIGFQSLSGALERGHDILYVCYDNGAYMNTGIQRSSATPFSAHTTTSPAGSVIPGKQQHRKDLTEIVAAHDIPYVAQASIGYVQDYINKVEKALSVEGPAFINVMSPCPLGWKYDPSLTIKLAKDAVTSKVWPLYEVVNGEYKLTMKPNKFIPVEEWMKPQGRFAHVFKSPHKDELIGEFQKYVDAKYERLLRKCGEEVK